MVLYVNTGGEDERIGSSRLNQAIFTVSKEHPGDFRWIVLSFMHTLFLAVYLRSAITSRLRSDSTSSKKLSPSSPIHANPLSSWSLMHLMYLMPKIGHCTVL